MTVQQLPTKKAELPCLGTLCLSLLLFFTFAMLLRRADAATACMREGHKLSLRPYFAAKLMQAILCPILLFILT